MDFICDHPSIRTISFVGSDRVGNYIYERGSAHGKRVQSNMGAKNHGVILPDANKDHTINQVGGRGGLHTMYGIYPVTTPVYIILYSW